MLLDETGSDRRDALRKRGCISMKGVLECTTVTNSVDGDTFYTFVHSRLLPLLMPFNGNNSHSVVIMDNASIHHVDDIMNLIFDNRSWSSSCLFPTLFT